MKKQQLNFITLNDKLTKAEMKRVVGGYKAQTGSTGGGGSCVICDAELFFTRCWHVEPMDPFVLCDIISPGSTPISVVCEEGCETGTA